MKKFIVLIGAIVASLPWIEQITELNLIPDYWELGPSVIAIVVSVLCFVVVAILYVSRQRISKIAKAKIIALTIVSFLFFTTAIISLLFILSSTKFKVDDCCIQTTENDCLSNVVFVPLFLTNEINDHLNEYNMTLEKWVSMDQCHVNEQLIQIGGPGIKSSFTKTMLLIYSLYLSVFVFLILAIVPLGYNSITGKT